MDCLCLMGCVIFLMMAGESSAGECFHSTNPSLAVGDHPRSVAVADLDGDSFPDLVTANNDSDNMSVLFGNGDGTFKAALSFWIGGSPISVAAADLDGDGFPDLVAANFDGGVITVSLNRCNSPVHPSIDIKPRRTINRVDPMNRGLISVAILGSETFDIADVDPSTLAFGPRGAMPAHRRGGHFRDVNADGMIDLVSHYRVDETGIAFGDAEACVTGELADGTPFEGCDVVLTTPVCGRGYEAAFLTPWLIWMVRGRQYSTR